VPPFPVVPAPPVVPPLPVVPPFPVVPAPPVVPPFPVVPPEPLVPAGLGLSQEIPAKAKREAAISRRAFVPSRVMPPA